MNESVAPLTQAKSSAPISTESAAGVIALFILAYWPYALLLETRVPWHILGFSVFVTIGPAFLTIVSCAILFLQRPSRAAIPMVLVPVLFLVALGRWALNISESAALTARDFAGIRYLVLLPCFFIAAGSLVRTKWLRRMTVTCILVVGAISAGAGAAESLGVLPKGLVPIASEETEILRSLGGSRATGISNAANQLGNFLVVPFILSALVRLPRWLRLSLMTLFIAGILATGSRFAIAGASFGVLIISSNRKVAMWQRLFQISALGAALFIAPFFVTQAGANVAGRFDQDVFLPDFFGRVTKTMLGVDALFEDASSILLGARPSALTLGNDADQVFSDNSFVQIAVSVGLPATLVFFGLMWLLVHRDSKTTRETRYLRVFWAVALSTAAVNNAILWDMNLFYSAVLYWLLISFSNDNAKPARILFRGDDGAYAQVQ